jgi:hypothetical protein
MTGEAFAQGLLDAGKIQSVGATIASNPEQSKHLATTRLKILGLEVDLVNLRSESYSKDSRIPSIVGHVLEASILPLIHYHRNSEPLRRMQKDETLPLMPCSIISTHEK